MPFNTYGHEICTVAGASILKLFKKIGISPVAGASILKPFKKIATCMRKDRSKSDKPDLH